MSAARLDVDPRRYSATTWLVVSGVVLSIIGLIAALAARRSADLASYVASQPTRLVGGNILSSTQMSGFSFDPSSAHYVPPDYTMFWIGMLVVALGLIVVAVGIGLAVAKRRAL